MKHGKVGSVMATDVVRTGSATPFKEVVRLLRQRRISGLPVVDEDEKVIGVISETDLMAHQAEAEEPGRLERRFGWRSLGRRARAVRRKARARTAGQLMTRPAVTVHAEDSIAEAARTMARRQVERLPIVDEEDRLVGIVTRRDLLQVFLRPDAEIRREVIQEVLVATLWLAPHTLSIDVQEGVVTLSGQLERRSETGIAVRMTRQIDGVVAVVDRLTYRFDDSHLEPDQQAVHGITEEWLRRL